MAGRTPNIDKLAAEGAIFTDFYAEASCTAGRSAFVTGELPIRTGLATIFGHDASDVFVLLRRLEIQAEAFLFYLYNPF
jgi:arylsulfatase A-like enzyme